MKKGHAKSVLYERVLIDGIATGLLHAGRKIQTLLVLLKPIPILFHGLSSVGVQYLKVVIPPLCESISIQSNNNNPDMKILITIAADGLLAVIQECWPRIPAYKGIIMRSLAKSWSFHFEKQDTEILELLKRVYKMFEAACQGKEKADKEALLKYKPHVFGPLFV
ncbi:hypothetical protein G6F56_008396 [Rhizopus delemar]|nr:hypothetical protein G6F56_008396 [Rhizopus delemar]